MKRSKDVVVESMSEIEIKIKPKVKNLEEKNFLFFDTETSGFINKKLPSNHPDQAWCIQIGGLLTNGLGKEIERLNILIQPDERSMHSMALATHGIELNYAQEHGIPEAEATNLFGLLLRKADLLICHNYNFDWNHLVAMWERNLNTLSDEARSAFYLDIPVICTMNHKEINKFCALKDKVGKAKRPKLTELYQKLFDCPFDKQHDAMADVLATKKCFFELLNLEIIELP